MPILQDDIKLLKSAVMADTSDGGGAMTGTIVIDGQSNNLFPDTSAAGRARGQVSIRQVYGVAHTSDNDTLLGAHAIITSAPADPLVHCAIVKSPFWGAERDDIKSAIEKYLVKGPKLAARLYDAHYSGSLQVRLLCVGSADFPAGGEAIVLINPNGQEQYVRLLKVARSTANVTFEENGATTTVLANIALCDLGQELAYDFFGPPAGRGTVPSSAAQVFSTNASSGTKFYGIKPLDVAAAPNDLSVMVDGGIFSPIVPAATVETPIIDQFPYLESTGITGTASAVLSIPQSFYLNPLSVIYLPTQVEPRTVVVSVGALTTFTDDGVGNLLQGTVPVGVVDYRAKTITMLGTSPAYSQVFLTVSYKPASPAGALAHSDHSMVTLANVGLSYVGVCNPAPARNTFVLHYMAQGRWYTLYDNGDGRLAGSDSSYGSGSVNYASGSYAYTLGAIPDIGSPIIVQWGDALTAQPLVGALPTLLHAPLTIPAGTPPSSVSLSWTVGGAARAAVCNAAGVLSGHASGSVSGTSITFQPFEFPDGDVTIQLAPSVGSASTIAANSATSFTLSGAPLNPGTASLYVGLVPQDGYSVPALLRLNDRGDGTLFSSAWGTGVAGGIAQADVVQVGTVDYTTGAVTLTASSVNFRLTQTVNVTVVGLSGAERHHQEQHIVSNRPVFLATAMSGSYGTGATGAQTLVRTPAWHMALPTDSNMPLVTTGTAFKVGGELYTAVGGLLRKGWLLHTGQPVNASGGSVSSFGDVVLQSLPANRSNSVEWVNAAQSASGRLVSSGVFRTSSAPLKTGVMQIREGIEVGNSNGDGELSGGTWSGSIDFQRGWVKWSNGSASWPSYTYIGSSVLGSTVGSATYGVGSAESTGWNRANVSGGLRDPSQISYNAVLLQYLPLDGALLGLETARLPLDGKVPVFRTGDLVVVHNTLTTVLPNPLTKGVTYDLGRERIASVRVKDALNVTVPSTLYAVNLNAGTLVVPPASNITAYSQPLRVEHRIEDLMLCSGADISGQIKFTRGLTHNFPAGTSFVSSALEFGDLFSRAYNVVDQQTWTNTWSHSRIGDAILANFNDAQYPILTTNRGAIKERWACIFTNNTSFRIVGENVGEIGTGSTATDTAPLNPATATPFMTIPALGWGGGRVAGNVLRFNTDACGAPFCPVRTVLQGPASLDSDEFTIAFRGDVDRP